MEKTTLPTCPGSGKLGLVCFASVTDNCRIPVGEYPCNSSGEISLQFLTMPLVVFVVETRGKPKGLEMWTLAGEPSSDWVVQNGSRLLQAGISWLSSVPEDWKHY